MPAGGHAFRAAQAPPAQAVDASGTHPAQVAVRGSRLKRKILFRLGTELKSPEKRDPRPAARCFCRRPPDLRSRHHGPSRWASYGAGRDTSTTIAAADERRVRRPGLTSHAVAAVLPDAGRPNDESVRSLAGARGRRRQVRAHLLGGRPVRLAPRRAVLRGRRAPSSGWLRRVPAGDGASRRARARALRLVARRASAFTILAGAGTVIVGALVARELGAARRAQLLAAVLVAFAPGMLATNWLFQPVVFDQLTTMVVLWLALRLALGRGSWVLLGVAVGIGLETKYTLAVVLVLLIATFLVWRRDVLRTWGFPLAVAIAAVLIVPNLVWEAGHGWTSVHFFLNPPPSGSDETGRSSSSTCSCSPRSPCRSRSPVSCRSSATARSARSGGRWPARSSRTSCSAASRTTRCRWSLFALAAGAIPLDRWLTTRRLWIAGAASSSSISWRCRSAARPAAPRRRAPRGHLGPRRLRVGGRLARVRAPGRAERRRRRRDRRVNYGEAGALGCSDVASRRSGRVR